MKALISLFILVLPISALAQSCPTDMRGINTTSHPVLRVGGRDVLGHQIPGVGDPNTDIRNWQNGIYNLFMQDGGSAHFYYDTVIYNQTGPIYMTNDDEHEIGACNENGQCVQVRFQVDYSTIIVPVYIRRLIGRWGGFIAPFQTRPSAVNISYTSPDGSQHNLTITAVNGVMPPSQPVIDRQPSNPDCLTNDQPVSTDNDNDDGDEGGEDEDDSYGDEDDYEWPEIELEDGDCSACEAYFDGDEDGRLDENPYEWIEEL